MPLKVDQYAASHLGSVEPNRLRDLVVTSSSLLSEDERKSLNAAVLRDLKKAGVNVGSLTVALGLAATASDELTPSDLGQLLRYVRINSPRALEAVVAHFAALSAQGAQAVGRVNDVGKAA